MHSDPVVNATLGPFLDTLPALGDVLSPEMWPPDLIPELQAPDSLVGQAAYLCGGRCPRVWRG